MQNQFCPVAALERQSLIAVADRDEAERQLFEDRTTPRRPLLEAAMKEANDTAMALRDASTRVKATSKRGLLYQLLELDIHADILSSTVADEIADAGFAAYAEKITRLIPLITAGVEALVPEDHASCN